MTQTTPKILSQLALIFFISGFSALLYQVSWQRLLFTNIGVDLSSITVVISVFMVGLGIGAYFGGRLADKFSQRVILLFCLAEAAIGLFGFTSYHLILGLGHLLVTANLWQVAFMNFLLLLLPTFMMGATLPLLTFYFNQKMQNIGESIGTLYFYNTLGAALGSLATGFILYNYLTLSQTVYLAACLNTFIALIVWFKYHKKEDTYTKQTEYPTNT
ncbi:MAG: fused MFS/spermidine synthase, partial [Alysiella sp.]|uniref:fused MFS/spermidine synthase n=1 Tax=Alysiella sp. TaxID=1872483 RepID=UPI0026DCCB9C